jgi:kynurenine formamidase
VVLDFRHKEKGESISAQEIKEALEKIQYELKPLDIVLTLWLIDQGIKLMGIDAITFDPPVWAMFERRQFWEAHMVMREREYYHLENLTNLDKIGRPFGFKLSVFPVKWVNTTAAPVRAVAIIDD